MSIKNKVKIIIGILVGFLILLLLWSFFTSRRIEWSLYSMSEGKDGISLRTTDRNEFPDGCWDIFADVKIIGRIIVVDIEGVGKKDVYGRLCTLSLAPARSSFDLGYLSGTYHLLIKQKFSYDI